ncbi:hypothetical protein ACP4OV_007513 [Aristida adscensionis]
MGKEYRCWEELFPDTLGVIFHTMPLWEVLTVVSRVCKPWERVVAHPHFAPAVRTGRSPLRRGSSSQRTGAGVGMARGPSWRVEQRGRRRDGRLPRPAAAHECSSELGSCGSDK